MGNEVFKKAFDEAKAKLAEAKDRRDAAEAELHMAGQDIVQYRRAVASLAVLCDENVEDSIGLTDAVRQVFQWFETWMSVKELKERIEMVGGSLVDLKNPDASLQSVLNRLAASGELQPGTRKIKNDKGQSADQKVWRPMPKEASAAPSQAPEPPLDDDDIPF